jgi:hypothetical protein
MSSDSDSDSDSPIADSDDPYNDLQMPLNAKQSHQFRTYQQMQVFVSAVAHANNFDIRTPKNAGTPDTRGHSGSFRCWCYRKSPNLNERPPTLTSIPTRASPPQLINARGQLRVECAWKMHFARHSATNPTEDYYYFTSRHLVHTGHSPATASPVHTIINSVRNVTDKMKRAITNYIKDGATVERTIKALTERRFSIKFETSVLHNVVNEIKSELYVYRQDDMKQLLNWLTGEKKDCNALFEYEWDDDDRVTRVFYQSADMRHNTNRNGEVIVMDTTMQTNRFNMPLCILVGVNEHNHTVLLAVALIRDQSYTSFEWVLQQLRTSMGQHAPNTKTVFTDGDHAMINAWNNVFPNAQLARCWFHLQLNLKHNLHSKMTSAQLATFLQQWRKVCLSATSDKFTAAKQQLHIDFPMAEPYLSKHIWKNQMAIANCYVRGRVTWDMYGTQRVESFNSKIKNMCERGTNTDVRTLFQRLRLAADETEQKEIGVFEQSVNVIQFEPKKDDAGTWLQSIFTVFASNKIMEESIKDYTITSVHFRDNIWKCTSTTDDIIYTVTITTDSMKCSCNYPQQWLLPCRHVLKTNLTESIKMHRNDITNQYRIDQIGERWRYRHQPTERLKVRLNQPLIIPASIGIGLSQLPTRRVERPKDRFRKLLSLAVTYIGEHYQYVDAFKAAEQTLTDLCKKIKPNAKAKLQSNAKADSDSTQDSDASDQKLSRSASTYSLEYVLDPLFDHVNSKHVKRSRIPNNGELVGVIKKSKNDHQTSNERQ